MPVKLVKTLHLVSKKVILIAETDPIAFLEMTAVVLCFWETESYSLTSMLHLQLWFELEFEFLKIILTLFVGSADVSRAATEKNSGVFVQQLCYVASLTIPACVCNCSW